MLGRTLWVRRLWGLWSYASVGRSRRGRLGVQALVLAFVALVLAPAVSLGDGVATVNTDALNLRSEPGTWAPVVDLMWQGAAVDVLDGPTDDGWYQVVYNGEVGWAYGDYLAFDGAAWGGADVGGVGAFGATAWVATDALNLRAGASTETDVIDLLVQGEAVTVIGSAVGGFVPVEARGVSAWVWSDYLSYDGPVDPGPERWIDIDRSSQTVTLYEGDTPIASYWGAMGFDASDDGFYATAIGTYYVYGKHAPLSWTEWGHAFIKYWVGFDPNRINGFHSYSMNENGKVYPWGDGPTGGCVALEPSAAAALFDFATIGMRVEVHR